GIFDVANALVGKLKKTDILSHNVRSFRGVSFKNYGRACVFAKTARRFLRADRNLVRPGRHWFDPAVRFAWLGCRLCFVMSVRAAQKWNAIQHMFLEPFEPEVDHRRDEESHHLGENKAADDHQSERPARRSVLTKTKRKRNCAHQRGECCHHDRPKTLETGFVDGFSQAKSFIDAF